MAKKHLSIGTWLFVIITSIFTCFALCCIAFHLSREKWFKTEILDARLQGVNAYAHALMSRGIRPEEIIIPEDNLRLTVIATDGTVTYDSHAEDSAAIENHLRRKEVRQAISIGRGHAIKRDSRTLGGKWFYSAASYPDIGAVIRTACPYDATLAHDLSSDKTFLWLGILLAVILMTIYFRFAKKLDSNVKELRIFADMAEKGHEIDNADITFPDNELGEISDDIVHLYARLQNSEDDKTRLKRQLTQNIAHELRTPVSSIGGYLETLHDNPDIDPATRKEFIDKCYAQSTRLGNLISDISLLAKLGDAPGSFTTEEVNLQSLFEGIRQESATRLEDRKMKMLILLNPDIVINGNQMLLYSIFRNLTDNAIAYAGEGTTITVQCLRQEGSKYVLSFADNGCGVPEEHLPHLFERFYRVDKGRSRKLGGTGLGLAIVKNAVILHGGRISVKIAKTGGLEFIICLAAD